MEMRDLSNEDLILEQMQKAKALQIPEALLAFTKEEGFELTNEELETAIPRIRARSEVS